MKVTNRKAVRRKGRMIVACNHISIADPIYLWGALRRNAVAVAMEELWKIPVINIGMWLLGHIPVKRGDKRSGERVMRASEAVLNWGGVLLIYPSAKCAKPGERLPFKSGVAVLAIRTNSPIIPAGIIGSNKVKPLGNWALNRSAKVRLNFGEAIYPGDFTGPNQVNDILAELERRIVALSV